MHSRHQLGLDGEPKKLSPDKLSGFRITAASARASILSMNGILWKDDGCAAQDDELTDIGVDGGNKRTSLPQTPAWGARSHLPDTREGTMVRSSCKLHLLGLIVRF